MYVKIFFLCIFNLKFQEKYAFFFLLWESSLLYFMKIFIILLIYISLLKMKIKIDNVCIFYEIKRYKILDKIQTLFYAV